MYYVKKDMRKMGQDPEQCIKLLRSHGIQVETGLTDAEVGKIEKIYGIQFPESLKEFLMEGVPISDGYYNWRNFKADNIEYIKRVIHHPVKYIEDYPEEVEWYREWGKEPECVSDRIRIVKKRLKDAPTLLPIYSHRYMPESLDENPPVISVMGVDIIFYGENLADYFKVELGEKKHSEINCQKIKPISFWSDIIDL